MITKIIMPKFGLTMKEGRISAWLKQEGDPVAPGDKVVEVSTPKVTHVLESRGGGVLRRKLAAVDATLPVGAVIAVVAEPDEALPELEAMAAPATAAVAPGAAPAAAPGARQAPGKKVIISPSARRLAEDLGVDYSQVAGTGPGGRIVKQDIEEAAARGGAGSAAGRGGGVELSPMRRSVWEAMDLSARTVARVTHFAQVEMSAVDAFRKEQVDAFEAEHGFRFTYTDVLVRVLALAVEADPALNVYLDEEGRLCQREGVHVGLAIALPGGLVVGKIPDAHKASLAQIGARARQLAARAREGRLGYEDSSGTSITLTTLGSTGIDAFTPIVNVPEIAILGVGSVKERPVVKGGQVVAAPTCWLTLSFDHRLIDGEPAARFLASVKALVEGPVETWLGPS